MSELIAGNTYSAKQMNEFIGGKHQGGIRYSGNFPELKRIGVIIGGGADAIYDDEVRRKSITYVGEGQLADQRLTFGNRALVWAHFNDQQVHVFVNEGKNRYRYLGSHSVVGVSATTAQDRNENQRGAFTFDLVSTDA